MNKQILLQHATKRSRDNIVATEIRSLAYDKETRKENIGCSV